MAYGSGLSLSGLAEPPIFDISGSGQIPAPTPTSTLLHFHSFSPYPTLLLLNSSYTPIPTLLQKKTLNTIKVQITLGSRKNSKNRVGAAAGQKYGSGSN